MATACSEGVPEIDTAPVEAALASVVRSAGFPDETFVELTDCPIADGDRLLEQIFAEVGGEGIDAALDAPPLAFVSSPNQLATADPSLACGRLDGETGAGVLLLVSDAPGAGLLDPDEAPEGVDIGAQWDGIADAYAARFGDAATDLDVRRIRDSRGGSMYQICIAEPDVPSRDSCEVAWFGGDVVVSAVATGPGSLRLGPTALEEALRRRLQLVVDGLVTG